MRAFYSFCISVFLFTSLFLTDHAAAQQINQKFFSALQWRCIGPFRGGRTVGASGVVQQPNVFYIGVNNGGVWKTTDYGQTWFPIFDDQPTGSIGTIAVAPSNPDIIYVGSGEGLHRPDLSVGDGIYKSTDGGKTWTHLGLRDGQQIPKIAVDPKNPERLFVAVLGHPYGPNEERGIYRSFNGGKTFEKILYIDENTGGDDVEIDPSDPNTIYATLWEAREGPWENGEWNGTMGGIFKSVDGGTNWTELKEGLPENLAQAHIAIAPSNPTILYTVIATSHQNQYGTGSGMGMYRSADKGETWKRISTEDGRPMARIGGGDLPGIAVDPKNAETIYSTSIVLWKSVDGGLTWKGIRGAPGGDDYQNIWINPMNPDIMLVTGDQGSVISVNGGNTWSSWYNQPTAQLYHVSADNDFPYNVYSGQQESGSVGIASRGNDGEITFRDWHPVGAQEYGFVVADPLNPDIVYGGKLSRYNKKTGQTQEISPEAVRSGKYRFVRTQPVLFSPIDPKTLYYSGNVLFKTTDGGTSWQVISPDLTRETWHIPESVGKYRTEEMKKMPRRGVIYAVAPSSADINTIWCGTDDGLIHITKDGGKTWKNVTPADITSWSKISIIDAGHYDVNTAYVAVNRIRCDDQHPYVYRTHDGGKSWKKIVNGLPDDPINVVREDPKQKGLLFAGSERAVYVSFDDGDHWQSLRLNMPASSVRDLIIKDNDIVVATHGRSFWILDNITSLRQLVNANKSAGVILFKPPTTYRVRWNTNTDTPLPPDEPAGQNPPDGAIIDYYLKENSTHEITLEILGANGKHVRKYSSKDKPYEMPKVNVPLYWIRPQQMLSGSPGAHRFIWDLHYDPLDLPPSFPIAAVYKNTAPRPTSPWVMPGNYTARLTVDGKVYSQTFTVKMDPRVKTAVADLQKQHDISLQCYANRKKLMAALNELRSAQKQVQDKMKKATGNALSKLKSFDGRLAKMEGAGRENSKGLGGLHDAFSSVYNILQGADAAPTRQVLQAYEEAKKNMNITWPQWENMKKNELKEYK